MHLGFFRAVAAGAQRMHCSNPLSTASICTSFEKIVAAGERDILCVPSSLGVGVVFPGPCPPTKKPPSGGFCTGGESGMTRAVRSPLRGRHRCEMTLSRTCDARLEPRVVSHPPAFTNKKAPW